MPEFSREIGHNCDMAIFTCYVRLVGIVPKFDQYSKVETKE